MAKKTKESKKIKGLVRIGVFSALWIAVSWAIACSIAFFAPVLLVLPCILALFGGLIYTVELSKLEILGGILVPSLLLGACLFTMVPYGMLFICSTVGGLIGEILYQTAGKRSAKMRSAAVALPMLGLALGEYIPMCFMRDTFNAMYADHFTEGVSKQAMSMMNTPVVIVLSILTVVLAFLGCLWGKKIAQKRLAKGGSTGERK